MRGSEHLECQKSINYLKSICLRKKSRGTALLENAIIISLIAIAAIYGLGSLGQSIRTQLELIFDDPVERRRNQIYQATHDALIEKGLIEADASSIATAAANAATVAYQKVLNAGGTPEEANRAAAWAAYTMAYDQASEYQELDEGAIRRAFSAYYDVNDVYRTALEVWKESKIIGENPEVAALGAAMIAAEEAARAETGTWEEYYKAQGIYYTALEVCENSKIIGENPEVAALGAAMITAEEAAYAETGTWEEYDIAVEAYYNMCNTALDAKLTEENPEVAALGAAMIAAEEAARAETGTWEEYYKAQGIYYTALEVWKESKIIGENPEVAALRAAMIAAEEAVYAETGTWEEYDIARNMYDNAFNAAVDRKAQEESSQIAELWVKRNELYKVAIDKEQSSAFAASEAAYKSTWETYNNKESSTAELVHDRAYFAALDLATTILTVLSDSQNITLDVATIATGIAESFASNADDIYTAVLNDGDASLSMASQLGHSLLPDLLRTAVESADMIWRDDMPNDAMSFMASDATAAIFRSGYANEAAHLSSERREQLAQWVEQMRNENNPQKNK